MSTAEEEAELRVCWCFAKVTRNFGKVYLGLYRHSVKRLRFFNKMYKLQCPLNVFIGPKGPLCYSYEIINIRKVVNRERKKKHDILWLFRILCTRFPHSPSRSESEDDEGNRYWKVSLGTRIFISCSRFFLHP